MYARYMITVTFLYETLHHVLINIHTKLYENMKSLCLRINKKDSGYIYIYMTELYNEEKKVTSISLSRHAESVVTFFNLFMSIITLESDASFFLKTKSQLFKSIVLVLFIGYPDK